MAVLVLTILPTLSSARALHRGVQASSPKRVDLHMHRQQPDVGEPRSGRGRDRFGGEGDFAQARRDLQHHREDVPWPSEEEARALWPKAQR